MQAGSQSQAPVDGGPVFRPGRGVCTSAFCRRAGGRSSVCPECVSLPAPLWPATLPRQEPFLGPEGPMAGGPGRWGFVPPSSAVAENFQLVPAPGRAGCWRRARSVSRLLEPSSPRARGCQGCRVPPSRPPHAHTRARTRAVHTHAGTHTHRRHTHAHTQFTRVAVTLFTWKHTCPQGRTHVHTVEELQASLALCFFFFFKEEIKWIFLFKLYVWGVWSGRTRSPQASPNPLPPPLGAVT